MEILTLENVKSLLIVISTPIANQRILNIRSGISKENLDIKILENTQLGCTVDT